MFGEPIGAWFMFCGYLHTHGDGGGGGCMKKKRKYCLKPSKPHPFAYMCNEEGETILVYQHLITAVKSASQCNVVHAKDQKIVEW